MTKSFPGLPEKQKMDWNTNIAAFYKHILSEGLLWVGILLIVFSGH